MTDLSTLTRDLTAAARLATEAADRVADTGSCNCDGVFLRLRVKQDKAQEAIAAAGLSAVRIERHSWFGTGYLISPPTSVRGQANKRSTAVATMYEHLDRQGWDVSHWYQAD